MKRACIISAFTAAVFGLSAGSSSAFLYDNGEFDSPLDLSDGLGWDAFGEGVQLQDAANGAPGDGSGTYAQVGDGEFGLAFVTAISTNGGFSQDVLVDEGRDYAFSIESNHARNYFDQIIDAGEGTEQIVFEWYSGDPNFGGTLISSNRNDITSMITDGGSDDDFPPGPSDSFNWQTWEYTNTAPAGATHMRTIVQWTANMVATNGDEWVRWDNAVLTTDLEPLNTDTDVPGRILAVDFGSQTNVIHTLERSTDLVNGTFEDAPVPPYTGDGSTQEYFSVFENFEAYRVSNVDDSQWFFDAQNQNPQPAEMGFSELFSFAFGSGSWDIATSSETNSGLENFFGVLVAVEGTSGGNGLSAHADVDGPSGGGTGIKGHGPLVDGNVIRFSCWVKEDPNAPFNVNEVQFALLKYEFYQVDFGANNPPDELMDTEDGGHPNTPMSCCGDPNIFTNFFNVGLLTTNWTQHVLEMTYKTAYFNASVLEEIRGVLVLGDFEGRTVTGNYFVDNVRMEIFDDAAEAAANPVDTTNPDLVPPTLPFDAITLVPEAAAETVVEWDGQRGVRYNLEYSEDGGSNWLPTVRQTPYLGVATGTRLQAVDPEGPNPARIYRVVVAQ